MENYINHRIAVTAFRKQVEEYNNSRPIKEVARRLPDGQEKIIRRTDGLVTGGLIGTGEKLILAYIKSFNKRRGKGYACWPLPSLCADSVALSGELMKTDRTIRNHIKALMQPHLNLIIGYKNNGRSKLCELWINPAILWPSQVEPVKYNFNA